MVVVTDEGSGMAVCPHKPRAEIADAGDGSRGGERQLHHLCSADKWESFVATWHRASEGDYGKEKV